MEHCLFLCPYNTFSRAIGNFRRCPPSKRNFIIAGFCFLYLFFVVSQVGHSFPHQDKRTDEAKYKRSRDLYDLGNNYAHNYGTVDRLNGANFDSLLSAYPTRSNVVYITVKSKRLKPAIIRGTVRPKRRSKVKRVKQDVSFTQNKRGTLDGDLDQSRLNRIDESWREIRRMDFKTLDTVTVSDTELQRDKPMSSIRIYSRKAPPWFSPVDISAMRFLADCKVSRIRELSFNGSPNVLLFERWVNVSLPIRNDGSIQNVCRERCGVISRSVDTTEVFAFHLDRVLGLNRTLPAVSRKFSFLQDGQPCPVVLWDPSLYPENTPAAPSAVKLTWGEYQSSLKLRCWHKNVTPKPDSGCSVIHHYEWSKLALFDFLLQIYNRLDEGCCGFKPRPEDLCVELGSHAECEEKDHIALANIIHRGHDARHLVFTNNKGFFDRDEDNLDFRLLEGIKEFPEQAVGVLRSHRLREKLLQSLFLDQVYWEGQGGRQGIEKLIDVIERRAKVLLTYINAHGIKTVSMNV